MAVDDTRTTRIAAASARTAAPAARAMLARSQLPACRRPRRCLRLLAATMGDEPDFTRAALDALAVAIGLVAVIAVARGGLLPVASEDRAHHVRSGRAQPVERLDRRLGAGLARFDHEHRAVADRTEQRRVGKPEHGRA